MKIVLGATYDPRNGKFSEHEWFTKLNQKREQIKELEEQKNSLIDSYNLFIEENAEPCDYGYGIRFKDGCFGKVMEAKEKLEVSLKKINQKIKKLSKEISKIEMEKLAEVFN